MFGLKLLKVTGESMQPVLPAGCFILVAKWLLIFPVKSKQRLVINHPKYGVIVKTVAIVDKNDLIWSRGENNGSLSIDQLGPVNKAQIVGRVIGVFKLKNI
jgi:nickel-type superoxide dismutase maturation protease